MNYTLNDFRSTHNLINQYINKTPIVSSKTFSDKLDLDLFFKLELFQKTGSFKVRGTLNKLLKLSDIEKQKGIITISAGNHAQAV